MMRRRRSCSTPAPGNSSFVDFFFGYISEQPSTQRSTRFRWRFQITRSNKNRHEFGFRSRPGANCRNCFHDSKCGNFEGFNGIPSPPGILIQNRWLPVWPASCLLQYEELMKNFTPNSSALAADLGPPFVDELKSFHDKE